MEKMRFAERVYAVVKDVPRGKVTTYKDIARALGIKSYQAIGQALRSSPGMPAVPCHRVICSDGNLGGFKGKVSGKAIEEKRMLLEKEGVKVIENCINLSYAHTFGGGLGSEGK